jgi:serine/threonine-protein kinase
VQLAARIDSAFVARVHDFGELHDGGLYFTMEKVAGTPFDRLLVLEGRVPPLRVIKLGQRLGEALAVVHALGLVHRDIKPSNLMLVSNTAGRETLKLLDFGIARAFEVDVQMGRAAMTKLTVAGTLLGSFAYMSPEQLAPRGPQGDVIGPRSDVYAAGITLFELVTGRLPYTGPTAPAFVMQHRSAPIPSVLDVLDAPAEDLALGGLDHVIRRALAKDPAQRFADGAALAKALFEVDKKLDKSSTERFAKSYKPDDTIPEDEPMGLVAGAVDPGALRGISTADVRERVASATIAVSPTSRITKGRVALGVAIALGLTTVLWDLFGTLPR